MAKRRMTLESFVSDLHLLENAHREKKNQISNFRALNVRSIWEWVKKSSRFFLTFRRNFFPSSIFLYLINIAPSISVTKATFVRSHTKRAKSEIKLK